MSVQYKSVVLSIVALVAVLVVLKLSAERTNVTGKGSHSLHRRLSGSSTSYEEPLQMIKKVLSLIYNRYEFGGPNGNKFFMASNNIGPETWDILKMKIATKMLTPNSTFLMIFSGSSVTAGHDNYYAQSYPYIFKKRMEDIFKKIGIELIVHDIAQGANNCSPYVLCYESMGGYNPDFLNWEQVSCEQ